LLAPGAGGPPVDGHALPRSSITTPIPIMLKKAIGIMYFQHMFIS
jgi:hypothetical protein